MIGCSKKKMVFNETNQGDFYLKSGIVYFQKSYRQVLSLTNIDKDIIKNNAPNGGLQVKSNDGEIVKGVIVNHQINWQKGSDRKMKVPDIMKRPINASFQIEKDGSGYKVTIQDIWFSLDQSGGKQKNTALESFFIQKSGLSFNKDKNTIKIIYYLSQQFSELFMLEGNQLENRFWSNDSFILLNSFIKVYLISWTKLQQNGCIFASKAWILDKKWFYIFLQTRIPYKIEIKVGIGLFKIGNLRDKTMIHRKNSPDHFNNSAYSQAMTLVFWTINHINSTLST